MNPLVSIALPCFNRAHTLPATLASIAAQTYRPIELVAIDDGSTDDTLQVLQAFAATVSFEVRIVSRENRGVTASRNQLLELCRGELLAFIDSDDMWLARKLERQVELMAARPEVGLCYTSVQLIDGEGVPMPIAFDADPSYRGRWAEAQIRANNIQTPTVVLRRDVVDAIGRFDESLRSCEDWDYWIRVAQRFEIDFVGERLTLVRRHANSLSQDVGVMRASHLAVLDKLERGAAADPALRAAIDDKRRDVYLHYGNLLLKQGRHREARADLLRARGAKDTSLPRLSPLLQTYMPPPLLQALRRSRRSLSALDAAAATWRLAALIFVVLALYALTISAKRPQYNWDVVGYVAAARSLDTPDIERLHALTYRAVRTALPPAAYASLVDPGNAYRHAVATDAVAFGEQLPFYRIRPIYNLLVYALHRAGMDIVFATHFISGVAVALAVALLGVLALRRLPPAFAAALPFLAVTFGVLEVARLSTPDALALLAIVAIAACVLNGDRRWLLVLMPLSIGVRTDLLLYVAPMAVFLMLVDRDSRTRLLIALIASTAVYFAINHYWLHPGWAATVRFALIEPLDRPQTTGVVVSAVDYFRALYASMRALPENRAFVLYLLVAGYSAALIVKRARAVSWPAALAAPTTTVALACVVFVVTHFVAFPVAWDRFFTAPYIVGALAFLLLWQGRALPVTVRDGTPATTVKPARAPASRHASPAA